MSEKLYIIFAIQRPCKAFSNRISVNILGLFDNHDEMTEYIREYSEEWKDIQPADVKLYTFAIDAEQINIDEN